MATLSVIIASLETPLIDGTPYTIKSAFKHKYIYQCLGAETAAGPGTGVGIAASVHPRSEYRPGVVVVHLWTRHT